MDDIREVAALGEALREFRKQADLTQEELAQKMEPPRTGNTISRWETGRAEIKYTALLSLLEALGRTLPDLFEMTPQGRKEETPDWQGVVRLFLSEKGLPKKITVDPTD